MDWLTPGHATIPRNTIENIHCASIDVSLKDLRHISRRATAFSIPFLNELQILERIYYKGKNQHRSAIYWRKVSEIRRFGMRIRELDFPGLVEDLRYTFYGTKDKTNAKVLRGAWKQSPDSDSCVYLLRRSRSVCLLVDQARARFRSAHGVFAQQIRTATFLPLAISLISITSRLDFLMSELREVLALLWQAVARVLNAITERGFSNHHNVRLPTDPLNLRVMPSAELGATRKRARVSTDLTEDFGSKVSRVSQSVPTTSQLSGVPFSTFAPTSATEVQRSSAHSGGITITLDSHPDISVASLPGLCGDSYQVTSPVQGVSRGLEERRSEPELAGNKRKVKRVKRSKRSDEIDHIFGF